MHKQIGFWECEELLPDSYLTGTTFEEYENGSYVLLSDEQVAFRAAHPDASQMEVWNMQLLPVPVRTVEQAKTA